MIFVMPGLDPGIHVLLQLDEEKTWMAGTSLAMTNMLSNELHSGKSQ
jgi:hypothetical protein